MTDDDLHKLAANFQSFEYGFEHHTHYHFDYKGFARSIEKASRRAALEEAWEAVHGERLEDPTETHGDMAYERVIADCENAIRALPQQDPQ